MTSTTCQTVTVKDAAAQLGISYRVALDLIKDKKLRARWLGNRFLVPQEAIQEFLAGSDTRPA